MYCLCPTLSLPFAQMGIGDFRFKIWGLYILYFGIRIWEFESPNAEYQI
jgi:hypothetical protein